MFIPKYIHLTNFISFKEQKFEFRNGEAILIQGKNCDDSSQKGNGSGKSSLIEAVAVAFSGSSIRDVVAKDLIYNDEKSAELELYLENPTINKTLKIWRKFYSNTKASECKIWVNGTEKTDLPDINAYNKYIFETLGISKEDFFNFYLITDENGFVPFLKSSDTKKKEIINRFSGADKVDLAFPFIEEDSKVKEQEITATTKEIERLQGQQTLLLEQMQAEEDKLKPEHINLQVEEKKIAIRTLESKISENKIKLSEYNKQKQSEQLKVDSFKQTNFDDQLSDYNQQKQTLETELAGLKKELSDCKTKFNDEIEDIKTKEQNLVSEKQSVRNDINEFEQFIDDVNNKLAGAITCPSCGHVFSLKDKTFNAKEAQESLPEAQKELSSLKDQFAAFADKEKEIEEAKQAINKKVLAEQELVKEKIFKNSVDSTSVDKAILEISTKKKEEENNLQQLKFAVSKCNTYIEQYEADIKSLELRIQNLNKEIDLLSNIDRSKIEELEAQLLKLITSEEELTEKLQILTEEKKNIDAWSINFKNFKSHLANQSLKNICDFTNMYLEQMGSNISIEIEGYRMLSNKKLKEEITTIVKKDGFPIGNYGKFSKGEKARIDICNVLANQELINLNSPTGGISLLFCDEVLDSVDELGLENIVNACQSLGKTIMIVTQNQVNSLPKHTLIIQKQNKVSQIL